MLKRLTLDNFTVFEHAEFEFGMLNVIHGENGTGKTHVLKAAYAAMNAAIEGDFDPYASGHGHVVKAVGATFAQEFLGVFKVRALSELVRHSSPSADLALDGGGAAKGYRSRLAIQAADEGKVVVTDSTQNMFDAVNFLPTTSLLHLKSTFALFYEEFHSDFEQTWRDLVRILRSPAPKSIDPAMLTIAEQLATDTGLDCYLDPGDNFHVAGRDGKFVYASLAAEGHRKLVTLLVLLRNGRIRPGSKLFFDEPEANLNPALLKVAAKAIVMLAQAGVQVFIATHSLFLMREIQVLLVDSPETAAKARYFGLHRTDAGVRVDQGPDPADTGDIAALDANLEQSARYMALQESL